jgi:uncharacterized protein YxeA
MLKSKRAEVGTTMTWVIATIIIVIILLVFLYGSTILGGMNKLSIEGKKLFVSQDYKRTDNWINTKTAMAYSLATNKDDIKTWADKYKIKLEDYVK